MKQSVKRGLMTDANGLPLSLVVAAENTHDIRLVADTLDALQMGHPGQKLRLCLDNVMKPAKNVSSICMSSPAQGRRYH